jgi:hypothetical protein
MSSSRRATAPALLIVLALAGPAAAAEPPAIDTAKLEKLLVDVLRDEHNRGADLYNNGDPAGCYRLFEGVLRTTRPLLSHRPELQAAIGRALDDAEKETQAAKRAFRLHDAIEHTRARLKAATPPPAEVVRPTPPTPPMPPSKPALDPSAGRVGPEKLGRVVADFFTLAAADAKVNLSRGGKYAPDNPAFVSARRFLAEYLLRLTGGKSEATPERIAATAKALQGLGLTGDEFDAGVKVLRQALEKNGVAAAEVDAVLKDVTDRRKDAVAPPPPPAPKPAPPSPPKPTPPAPPPAAPATGGTVAVGGKVTGADGQPLVGLELMFVSRGVADIRTYDAKTGPGGAYKIDGVRPGSYTVVASPPPALAKSLAKYATTTTSPLVVEVKGGPATFDFNLK